MRSNRRLTITEIAYELDLIFNAVRSILTELLKMVGVSVKFILELLSNEWKNASVPRTV